MIYDRIKELCERHEISVAKLEASLGFGNGIIKRWSQGSSPTVDKVMKIANYFDVSVDYLTGRSDIEGSVSDIIGNADIISFQRAREKMSQGDRERMMKMLRLGFDYAFSDDNDGSNEENK